MRPSTQVRPEARDEKQDDYTDGRRRERSPQRAKRCRAACLASHAHPGSPRRGGIKRAAARRADLRHAHPEFHRNRPIRLLRTRAG